MYSLLNHFFFTSILNIYAEPQLKWHLQYDNLHEDNTLLLLRPIPVRTIGKKCAISLARTWQHLGDELRLPSPLSPSPIRYTVPQTHHKHINTSSSSLGLVIEWSIIFIYNYLLLAIIEK